MVGLQRVCVENKVGIGKTHDGTYAWENETFKELTPRLACL